MGTLDIIDTAILRVSKTYPADSDTCDRFDALPTYTDCLVNLFM